MTGLPSTMDEALVRSMFTDVGLTVNSVRIMYDTWGVGFSAATVAFVSQDEAEQAMCLFNGQVVEFADTAGKEDGADAAAEGAAEGAEEAPLILKYAGPKQSEMVAISNVPAFMDENMLRDMFKDAGLTVKKITLDKAGGCIIQFGSALEAAAAIEGFSGKFVSTE